MVSKSLICHLLFAQLTLSFHFQWSPATTGWSYLICSLLSFLSGLNFGNICRKMWVCVLAAETFSPSTTTKREEVVGGSKAPSEEKKKKKEKNWRTSRWRPPRAPALLLLQQHSLTHTRLWLDRKIGGKNLHFWKVNRHPFYPHHHANLPVLPNAKDTKCKEQFEIYLEIHIFFQRSLYFFLQS